MNLTLVKNAWWAVAAVAFAGGCLTWLIAAGAAAGAREGSDVDIMLTSGWVTLSLMVFVCAYSLRKFIHKLGLSPEFRMKVPLDDLEQAHQALNEIRRQVMLGLLDKGDEILDAAQRALESCGVHKVCKAKVTPNPSIGPNFILSVEPTEPLGRMAKWLHFHVYLGLASGVTLWVHGGLSMASPMGVILNVLAVLVIITGVIGTALFALGPRWMTKAEKDLNYEEAFVLERSLTRKIKAAYQDLAPEQVKRFRRAEKTDSTAVVERTALLKVVETEPDAAGELADIMVLVSQRKRILEDLRDAARVKFLINVWRVVHVPASIVLLGFSIVHVVSVIWY